MLMENKHMALIIIIALTRLCQINVQNISFKIFAFMNAHQMLGRGYKQ